MKKRALVGQILLLLVILLVIAGVIAFFTGTVRIPIGDKFNVDVSYNPEDSSENPLPQNSNTLEIVEIPAENNIDLSLTNESNLSFENNNSYNLTNISE